ncbi:MAG: UbiA family prenyltransferase [Patescibacteria group bacterium]
MIAGFIKKLENTDIDFKTFLIVFFGVVLVRFVLESFASHGFYAPFYGFTGSFLHFPIWFASVFVWLMIFLKLITGESIEKIARFQIFLFPIIWFPPLFDLLITGGAGIKIHYIFASALGEWKDYFLNFFFKSNISPGLRIESIVILAFVGAYVYFKTQKKWLIPVAVVGVYSILFLHGSFPSVPLVIQSFDGNAVSPYLFYKNLSLRQDLLIGENYLRGAGFSERSEIFFNIFSAGVVYVGLIVGLAVALFLRGRNEFFAFIRNIRPLRLFHYWLTFFLGVGAAYLTFGIKPVFDFYNLLGLAVILLSVAFAWLRSVFENDLNDLEADKISNSQRPLVKKEISADEAKKFNLVLFGLSAVGALIVGYHAFILILFAQFIAFIYSTPPFQLKKFPIVNPVLIAVVSVSVILNGFFWLAPSANMEQFPLKFLLAALIIFSLGANFKDIKDFHGDKKAGIKTIPVIFGEKNGKMIVGVLFFLAALGGAVVLNEMILLLPAIVFGAAGFFLINRERYSEKPVFAVYFAYILSIILFYGLK